MLTLYVVDRSAEARTCLAARINAFLQADLSASAFLPQLSVKPLAVEELKFHSAPDICIIGDEVVAQDICEVGRIRKLMSDAALFVRLTPALQEMAIVEQLARFGVDDVLAVDASPQDFLRKLVLLSRRKRKARSGKLIVIASGKGGVGVTSLAAALGEALAARGGRCVLLDFDFETQDLSRFLQARPFLNENLQLLFAGSCPVTQETVEQCLVPVWEESSDIYCMPPFPETAALYDLQASEARVLLSVLEVLDALFSFVVVDVGCAKGTMLRSLLRVADALLFVVNNDPASLYASVDRLAQCRAWLAPDAELALIENASQRRGLSHAFMRREFEAAAQLSGPQRFLRIPACSAGGRWPASGGTLYSRGGRAVARAVQEAADLLNPPEKARAGGFSLRTLLRREPAAAQLPAAAAPAPALPENGCSAALPPAAVERRCEPEWDVAALISRAELS